jgi:hypothetical protein
MLRYKHEMQFPAKNALLLLVCLVAVHAAPAQERQEGSNGAYRTTHETRELPHKATGPRLLTRDDGLAVLGAALDAHHPAEHPSDCSHFVHGLYERAGFPYGYASSSDLYAGINEFRRVASPQPGDIEVWRGHAGIVINPAQHSFFSLLSSGPGVDYWDSSYWKQWGQPRFFRYVKAVPSGKFSSTVRTASLKP